jgi:hypothetical protein
MQVVGSRDSMPGCLTEVRTLQTSTGLMSALCVTSPICVLDDGPEVGDVLITFRILPCITYSSPTRNKIRMEYILYTIAISVRVFVGPRTLTGGFGVLKQDQFFKIIVPRS